MLNYRVVEVWGVLRMWEEGGEKGRAPPEAGEGGEGGDAAALQVEASRQVEIGQPRQLGEGRQRVLLPDALAVLQLEPCQAPQRRHRQQPAPPPITPFFLLIPTPLNPVLIHTCPD